MKFIKNKFLYVSISIIAFTVFLIPIFRVSAAAQPNVFGWAWSDSIGWISFNNCKNPTVTTSNCGSITYGVNYDVGTKEVSGYAWNDNIGWISFNPSDWGACPPGMSTCSSNKWQTGSNTWARAISGKSSNSGGWDGWISFNHPSYSSFGSSVGSTDVSGNSVFSGYNFGGSTVYAVSGTAWGSDIVGYVDLSGVYVVPGKPTITLTPNKASIFAGDKVNFSWTAKNFNPTSCEGITNVGYTGITTDYDAFSDWIKSQGSGTNGAGTISGIEVKYDPTNTVSKKTVFIFRCKNGSNPSVDSTPVTITVSPLKISFVNNIGCMTAGSKPRLYWVPSTASVNSCTVKAVPSGGTEYPVTIGSPSFLDSDFKGVTTTYTVTCKSALNANQNQLTVSSNDKEVNMCIPDYTITSSALCSGDNGIFVTHNAGVDDGSGNVTTGTYSGSAKLTINPIGGYKKDVTLSYTGGPGTLNFSPSSFSYLISSYSNKDITATFEMPDTGIDPAGMGGGSSTNKLNQIGTITVNAYDGTTNFNFDLKLWNANGCSIKPIYKPF